MVADELFLPPDITTRYQLSIHVVAEGFRLDQGESWRREIEVTGHNPYPTFTYHLIPDRQEEEFQPRAIRATFAADGQTMGFAVRPVVVVATTDLASATAPDLHPAIALALPTADDAPDLTIHIMQPDASSGRLLWTWESPHNEVNSTDEPGKSDIGADPSLFAQQFADGVRVQDTHEGIFELLVGKGTRIADKMPKIVRDVLRQVCDISAHTPTILLLSEEPYVPWELAVIDPPLWEANSPFLSGQLNVGRWILAEERPKSPPPSEKQVMSFGVVHTIYTGGEWGRTEFAEQEAAELQILYDAFPVEATAHSLRNSLRGRPPLDVMHFAMHGNYDRTGILNGLIMVDGWVLTPDMIRARRLERAPFVFLNSCQVGRGEELLGDYAGLAAAFLYAGATAVVAPIWNVDDEAARSLALNFYAQAKQGRTPSEILREERALFVDSDEGSAATHVAYLFFGHPKLQLVNMQLDE